MTLHNKPKYQIPALTAALKQHGLEYDKPSQLSDAFRTGWVAALATSEQPVSAAPAPTDAEIHAIADQHKASGHGTVWPHAFARAVLAAHSIK